MLDFASDDTYNAIVDVECFYLESGILQHFFGPVRQNAHFFINTFFEFPPVMFFFVDHVMDFDMVIFILDKTGKNDIFIISDGNETIQAFEFCC